MFDDHIHIGLHNIIGDHLSKYSSCNVISHTTVNSMQLKGVVSISAFDPKGKITDLDYQELLPFLLANEKSIKKILYISSSRILDDPDDKYKNYVRNKLNEEKNIAEIFGDRFACLYLPNLISYDTEFDSRFLKLLRKNFSEGKVEFDTTPDSYWNFVTVTDVMEIITRPSTWERKFTIIDRNHISAANIADIATKISPTIVPKFGNNFTRQNIRLEDVKIISVDRKETVLKIIEDKLR